MDIRQINEVSKGYYYKSLSGNQRHILEKALNIVDGRLLFYMANRKFAEICG